MKHFLLIILSSLVLFACSPTQLEVKKGKPGGIYVNGVSGPYYPSPFGSKKQLDQDTYISFDQIKSVSKQEHSMDGMFVLGTELTPEGLETLQKLSEAGSELELNFLIADSIIISPVLTGTTDRTKFEVMLRGDEEINYIIAYLTQD